jgi:3,4-dihydroxy 2-butanone 4-phosphate synthase/GTP cyclohydrolase II
VNDDGSMARLPELRAFAKRHGFLLVNIADLIAYRLRTEAWTRTAASGGGNGPARTWTDRCAN